MIPTDTASSTTYWMAGLSTSGSISFGCALVAGKKARPQACRGDDRFANFPGHRRASSGACGVLGPAAEDLSRGTGCTVLPLSLLQSGSCVNLAPAYSSALPDVRRSWVIALGIVARTGVVATARLAATISNVA